MLKKFSQSTVGRTVLFTGAGLLGTFSSFSAGALSNVTNKLEGLIKGFRTDVTPLITVIGGVALIIAFATAMVAKDSKVSQNAWAWVKRIIITLICIWAVNGILAIIKTVGQEINTSAGGKNDVK